MKEKKLACGNCIARSHLNSVMKYLEGRRFSPSPNLLVLRKQAMKLVQLRAQVQFWLFRRKANFPTCVSGHSDVYRDTISVKCDAR